MKSPILILAVLFLSVAPISAENAVSFTSDSLTCTASTTSYVYAPGDTIHVHYDITNLNHPQVILPFSSSKHAHVEAQTSGELTWLDTRRFQFVTTDESISTGGTLRASTRISPGLFVDQTTDPDNRTPMQPQDGDTLTIRVHSDTRAYGITHPDDDFEAFIQFARYVNSPAADLGFNPQFDANDDGVINFSDYIRFTRIGFATTWHTLPAEFALTLQIYIRNKTADLNRDGSVTQEDLARFVQTFGSTIHDPLYDARTDLNGDGQTDYGDFSLFHLLYHKAQ
ncbi:MAG: hypothetical protein O2954_09770 [bacterium]|nr:hypothetical protein [bacterium]